MSLARTLVAMLVATGVFASPAYHLELQSSPASVAPLLSKFGTMEIHVYGGGVRVESMWLDSFSRNGSAAITLLNPLAHMYTDVAINDFPELIANVTGIRKNDVANDVPALAAPVGGKVNGIDARRYRLSYTPAEWIDIWTTTVVPENPQLRRIVSAFVQHFVPGMAAPLARIPGNPIYIELNTELHPKHPVLQMKSLHFSADGEHDALRVGKWYLRAPIPDAVFH